MLKAAQMIPTTRMLFTTSSSDSLMFHHLICFFELDYSFADPTVTYASTRHLT